MAHPYLQDYVSEFENIEELIKAGLKGIEYPSILDKEIPEHYPENSREITQQIKILAKKYNLILTSGSDYHGSVLPDCQLGSNDSDESVVIALRNALKNHA